MTNPRSGRPSRRSSRTPVVGYALWKDLLGFDRRSPQGRLPGVLWHQYSAPEAYIDELEKARPQEIAVRRGQGGRFRKKYAMISQEEKELPVRVGYCSGRIPFWRFPRRYPAASDFGREPRLAVPAFAGRGCFPGRYRSWIVSLSGERLEPSWRVDSPSDKRRRFLPGRSLGRAQKRRSTSKTKATGSLLFIEFPVPNGNK